jgi:hypothetical protein
MSHQSSAGRSNVHNDRVDEEKKVQEYQAACLDYVYTSRDSQYTTNDEDDAFLSKLDKKFKEIEKHHCQCICYTCLPRAPPRTLEELEAYRDKEYCSHIYHTYAKTSAEDKAFDQMLSRMESLYEDLKRYGDIDDKSGQVDQ